MSLIKLDVDGFLAERLETLQAGTEGYYLSNGFVELPDPPGVDYQWDGQSWISASRLTLEDVRNNKAREIDQACRSTILAGFDSDALGTTYHYPAKATDQSNLSGSVLASLLPDTPADWVTPFWCADINGLWEFRLHTAAQIQQVGRDAKAAILAAMGRNEVLQAQISAATSIEELEAVGW